MDRKPTDDSPRDPAAREPAGAGVLSALVEAFASLPGIGRKTADRLAYHILRVPAADALRLADAIRDVKQKLRYCSRCFHIAEGEICSICDDPLRDPRIVCVVEEPKDLLALEASGSYRGHYHVLHGAFSALDGVGPRDLTIDALLARLASGVVEEVILATNPDFEGDGTALLVREKLKSVHGLKITRIARGVPSGSHIEHAGRNILSDAIDGRREMPE